MMKKLLERPTHIILATALGMTALLMTSPLLAQAVKVEVVKDGGEYQLLRDGQPYRIKGVGYAHTELESLAAFGGNSIRTWSTDGAGELLDAAHELGITVTLCIYTAPERYGFNYNDPKAVAEQKERIRGEVLKYKDHPALLTWLIGNELNYDYKNPKVYDAVNDISRMIHELDPNHPTSTALAGFNEAVIDIVKSRAPDLDFLSFQVYGQLYDLPRFVKDEDFEDPYFITEWGAIGHWEVGKTSWGAPLEQTSSEKAATYQRGYDTVIKPAAGQNIGDYVFLWGWKQEKTPTWYGIFTQTGEATEVMDVLEHIWTGSWPQNRAPQIEPVRLNGKTADKNVKLKPGKTYRAEVLASDSDGDPLTYKWQVKKESDSTQLGGDYEEYISNLPDLIADPSAKEINMKAPSTPGAYRLFVYAYDGQGHAAHANIPFYVNDPEAGTPQAEDTQQVKTTDEIIFNGDNGKPWRLYLGSMNNWMVPINGPVTTSYKSNVLSVRWIENGADLDTIQAEWKGGLGQIYWQQDSPKDYRELAEQGAALSVVLRVDKRPKKSVDLKMDCGYPCAGALNMTRLLKAVPENQWFRISLKLSCFEESGANLANIIAPLVVATKDDFTLSISDVRITMNPPPESVVACN